MARYNVQFIHKVSLRKDILICELADGAFSDSATLAKALRKAHALQPGERLREFRVEGEKTHCFPDRGIWHCLTITPADD